MCRLGVTLYFGHTVISSSLPENLSRLFVECIDLPGVSRIILNWSNVAVKPITCLILSGRSDCSGNENLVPPNYGTRMAQSWNLCFPSSVLKLLTVPSDSRMSFCYSRRSWSPKLRPVLRVSIDNESYDD